MTVENISTYVLNRATTIEDDINIRIELLVARGDLIKQIPKINYERQEPMSVKNQWAENRQTSCF